MIDLHSHVLPDIDDGARSVEEALQIVAAAARDGVTAMAATPHVREDYPTTAAEMLSACDRLREAIAAEGIAITLLPGAELSLEELDRRDADELARFGLGGNPSYLLLEFPYLGWPLRLASDVARLVRAGLTPVLAHPDRNDEVQRNPASLAPLVDGGALVQLTASSITRALGPAAAKAASELLRLRLAHLVASDAHAPSLGRVGLKAAAAAIRDEHLGTWLTEEIPAAIVGGDRLPDRPSSGRRAKLFRGGLRR